MNALLLSILLAAVSLPNYSGPVNDFAGVLAPQTRQELTQLFQDVRAATGAELAVVTVETVAPLDSKSYAVELFKKWGIGQKGKDNGVLVLLAVKDRRVEIEVGYGLEGILPDARCGRILDAHGVPNFRRGEWSAGLVATARAIADVVRSGKPEPASRRSSSGRGEPLPWWSFPLLIFALGGGGWLVNRWRSRCPKCGYRPLTTGEAVVANPTMFTAGRLRRDTRCPKCGYHGVEYVPFRSPGSYSSGGFGGGSFGSGGGGGFSFGGGGSGGGGAGRSF